MEQYRIRSISKAQGGCFNLETEVCDRSFVCDGDMFMRVRPIPGDVFWVHLGKICFVVREGDRPPWQIRTEERIDALEKRVGDPASVLTKAIFKIVMDQLNQAPNPDAVRINGVIKFPSEESVRRTIGLEYGATGDRYNVATSAIDYFKDKIRQLNPDLL
jgi:hypothetical protein